MNYGIITEGEKSLKHRPGWLSAVRAGWRFVSKHPGLLLILGLYHAIWTGLGFRWIGSFIETLLSRYPGAELGEMAIQVFWAEAQFRIMKSNMLEPWLWLIGGILLLRMICHPLLHAGILYAVNMHQTRASSGHEQKSSLEKLIHSFKVGVQTLGAVFSMLYFIQIVLILLPLLWLVPQITSAWQSSFSVEAVLEHSLLSLTAYLMYILVIRALILFYMLKKTQANSIKPHRMRLVNLSSLSKVILLSLLFIMTATLLSAGFSAVAAFWPGVLAIGLHLMFGFFRSGLLLWEISACYHSSQS